MTPVRSRTLRLGAESLERWQVRSRRGDQVREVGIASPRFLLKLAHHYLVLNC
jgi:hypothetical protein